MTDQQYSDARTSEPEARNIVDTQALRNYMYRDRDAMDRGDSPTFNPLFTPGGVLLTESLNNEYFAKKKSAIQALIDENARERSKNDDRGLTR